MTPPPPDKWPKALISQNGRTVSLHSTYNPLKEGERLFSQPPPSGASTLWICLGMGLGYHLLALPKSSLPVIVFQDSQTTQAVSNDHADTFRSVWDRIRLPVYLFNEFQTEAALRLIQTIASREAATPLTLQTVTLPGYERLCPRFCADIRNRFRSFLPLLSVELATIRRFAPVWRRNEAKNRLFASAAAPPPDWKGKTVCIAAAGPSLNHSVSELRRLTASPHGETFRETSPLLVATDTALPFLIANRLPVHAVLTIDCQHYSLRHHQCIPQTARNSILYIGDIFSDPNIPPLYPHFTFVYPPHPRFSSRPTYATGGNVTYSAVSVARMWGAARVFLFGADFSYQTPSGSKSAYCKATAYEQNRRSRHNRFCPLEASHYRQCEDPANEEPLHRYRGAFEADFSPFIAEAPKQEDPEHWGRYHLIFEECNNK